MKEVTCKKDNSTWACKCIQKSSLSEEDEEALEVEVRAPFTPGRADTTCTALVVARRTKLRQEEPADSGAS